MSEFVFTATSLTWSDVQDVLQEYGDVPSLSTHDLSVEQIGEDEYEVTKARTGHVRGNVWFWFDPAFDHYVADCNCFWGKKEIWCRHLLAVLKTMPLGH